MPVETGVAVIVPAYNAAGTIVETLQSVSAQTYRDLEIIVVDDGSTDDTAKVVENYARGEGRLRLIRQRNAGVAAARNAGLAAARQPYIAPIDSDDLWHPTRVERHVAALDKNPRYAFVYSLFHIVNEEGRVIGSHPFFAFSGHVFYRQLFYNMVGNGSGMTFRRDVAIALGGYDTSLQAAGLHGCEDWLLQMLMSIDHEVGHVPDYLIGYRKAPGAMSADVSRMWASQIMALEILRNRVRPSAQQFIESAKLSFSLRLAFQELRKAHVGPLIDTVGFAFEQGLLMQLFDEVFDTPARSRRGRDRRRQRAGAYFRDIDPTVRTVDHLSPYAQKAIRRLQAVDQSPALFESYEAAGL